MAGDFLPPVVTVLTGDISDLRDKVAEAKTLIKSLGNQTVTVDVRFNINDASFARTIAAQKALNGAFSAGILNNRNYQRSADGVAASFLAMDAAASRLNRTISSGGGGRRMPGWIGWLTDPGNLDAVHGATVAVLALGAAVAGATVGLGSAAIVAGPAAIQMVQLGAARYLAGSAVGQTIPQMLGLKTNPFMAGAQSQGTGQLSQIYGGLINFMNNNQNSGVATEGSSVLSNMDRMVAKFSELRTSGAGFGAVVGTLNQDATNLGHALSGIGGILDKAFKGSPGEIEWLTNGLGDVLGLLNKIASVPGLMETFMMLHSLTFLSGLLGKGMIGGGAGLLGAAGGMGMTVGEDGALMLAQGAEMGAVDSFAMHGLFGKLGSNLTGLAAGLIGGESNRVGGSIASLFSKGGLAASRLGLGTVADATIGAEGSGLAGTLMGASGAADGLAAALAGLSGAPLLAIGAAAVGLGILVARANGAKTAVQGLQSRFQTLDATRTYQQLTSALPTQMRIMGQTSSSAQAIMNTLVPAGADVTNGYMAAGITRQDLRAYGAAETAAAQSQAAALQEGHAYVNASVGIEQIAHALGVSFPQAAMLATQAGVHFNGVTGQITGGLKTALAQINNTNTGLAIFKSTIGQIQSNTLVNRIVGSRAFQSAQQQSGNYDTYFGAMTGGAGALGGILNALQGTAPLLSGSKFLTGAGAGLSSFINTNQTISGSLEPMMDFFRQGQSIGAASTPQMKQGFIDAGAALNDLAKDSPVAQAEILAMVNTSGTKIKSWADLMKAAGGTVTTALGGLNGITQTVTANFAKFGTLGQQVAADMTDKMANAIATVANKYPNLKNQIAGVVATLNQYGPSSKQAQAADLSLAQAMKKNGSTYQEVNTLLASIGSNWRELPNGQFKQNTFEVVYKTVTVTSATVGQLQGTYNQQVPAAARAALGVRNSAAGWSWVGEKGPELIRMAGGEEVIPNHRVSQYLANGTPGHDGGCTHNHFYIDGKEIFPTLKQSTYQYNQNNGNRDAQGRVSGTVRPR